MRVSTPSSTLLAFRYCSGILLNTARLPNLRRGPCFGEGPLYGKNKAASARNLENQLQFGTAEPFAGRDCFRNDRLKRGRSGSSGRPEWLKSLDHPLDALQLRIEDWGWPCLCCATLWTTDRTLAPRSFSSSWLASWPSLPGWPLFSFWRSQHLFHSHGIGPSLSDMINDKAKKRQSWHRPFHFKLEKKRSRPYVFRPAFVMTVSSPANR